MGLLTWILVGLVAGFIAQLLLGGGLRGGGLRRVVLTIVLGVAGALIGGLISSALGWGDVTGFNLRSLIIAVGGAVLLIAVWRVVSSRSGNR